MVWLAPCVGERSRNGRPMFPASPYRSLPPLLQTFAFGGGAPLALAGFEIGQVEVVPCANLFVQVAIGFHGDTERCGRGGKARRGFAGNL